MTTQLARSLERIGFECTCAQDGLVGLELVRTYRVDLVLLDVELSFVDGFGLLRRMRQETLNAETPVLMLGASHNEFDQFDQLDQVDRARAEELGANAFMSKPLQLQPLTRMIDTLVH